MQRVVELSAAIVPTLIEALEEKLPADEWYNYNYMASEALGLIGEDAAPAVPTLCKLLKESKDPGVREQAAVALGRIGANPEETVPALTSALDDGWAKVRAAAAEALLSFGKDAKPALKKLRELEDSEYASVRKPVKAAIAALIAPTPQRVKVDLLSWTSRIHIRSRRLLRFPRMSPSVYRSRITWPLSEPQNLAFECSILQILRIQPPTI